MATGFEHLHSLLRWILLILLILTVTKAVMGSAKRFFEKDRKMALVVMILAHIQLLTGLFLYMVRGYIGVIKSGMPEKAMRFAVLEHPVGMILAIALITIGYSRVKRGTSDAAKKQAVKVFYGLALLIILVSIPWPFREGMAHYGWM